MAKAPEPKFTQDDPTAPRPVSPEGRTLDTHGLPLNGPARVAALGGKPDPALAPGEVAETAVTPPAKQD